MSNLQEFMSQNKVTTSNGASNNATAINSTVPVSNKSSSKLQSFLTQNGGNPTALPIEDNQEGDNFGTKLAYGVAKPFVKLGLSAAHLIQPKGLSPAGQALEDQYTRRGQDVQINSLKEGLGTGIEAIASVYGGGTAENLGKDVGQQFVKQSGREAFKKLLMQGAKEGATVGGAAGLGTGLQDENKNVGGAIGEGLKGAALGGLIGGGVPIAGNIAGKITRGANDLIGGVASQSSFENKVNKVLPVLKKDVPNLASKQRDAYTAFSDIAQNKESLGLTGRNGEARNPENYTETVDAQNKRLPEIYKNYTDKLSTVDRPKFDADIKSGIQEQVNIVDNKLSKENSLDNQRALSKIKNELKGLRDTSPEGIQNYIQTINQKIKPLAPGGALTPEQIQYANLGGQMRKVLDDSIEKIDGKGYQTERNIYKAHKTIQSQLLDGAKKEINNIPGLTDKLTNLGMTAEGINFLLTHDPASLAVAGGLKLGNKLLNWYRSPQRALQGIFNDIEKGYKIPSPRSPSNINQIAKIEPIATNIPTSKPRPKPKVKLPAKPSKLK